MTGQILSIYTLGDSIGSLSCYVIVAIMVIATVFVMRKYVKP